MIRKHLLGTKLIKWIDNSFDKPRKFYNKINSSPVNINNLVKYKDEYDNIFMDLKLLKAVDNYMIKKNVGLPQRQAILYTIWLEGSKTGPHGNGASGLVGWKGLRAKSLPNTIEGQAEKLYNETFGSFNSNNWNHGGEGSGYKSGKEALLAFLNAKTVKDAIHAFNYGYVRPDPNSLKKRTTSTVFLMKKGGKVLKFLGGYVIKDDGTKYTKIPETDWLKLSTGDYVKLDSSGKNLYVDPFGRFHAVKRNGDSYYINPSTLNADKLEVETELPEVTVTGHWNPNNMNSALREMLPDNFTYQDVRLLGNILGYTDKEMDHARRDYEFLKSPWGNEKGLKQVSPEFLLLTLGRGINNGAFVNSYNEILKHLASNSAVKHGIKLFLTSELAAKGIDAGTKFFTGKDWGDWVAERWKNTTGNEPNLVLRLAIDFLHPGYFTPAEPLERGILNLNNNLNKASRFLNTNKYIKYNQRFIESIFKPSRRWYTQSRRLTTKLNQDDRYKPYAKIIDLYNDKIDKAEDLLVKLHDKNYRSPYFNFTEEPVVEYTTHLSPDVNFELMTPELRLKFFEKHSLKGLEPWYNPKTGKFEFVKATGFNPLNAVTIGDVTLKDLISGESRNFYLSSEKLKGSMKSSTEVFDPKTLESTYINNNSPTSELTNTDIFLGYQDYLNFIKRNLDHVTNTILPGSKAFGSTSNVAKGNLFHAPHDYDVIMTAALAKAHPLFKLFYWRPGRENSTYVYNHPTAGEIDVNVINEKGGKAYGEIAHEVYALLYPTRYRLIMGEYARKGPLSTDLPLDVSALKLLEAYDPITKGIVDSFASGKDKLSKRAIYYLNYGDLNDVSKGFYTYANYVTGGTFKPNNVPLSEFTNPERNSELIKLTELDKYGINESLFIYNPEKMKLLFDYYILDKNFLGRGIPNDKNIFKSLTYWYAENNGGSAQGSGLNTYIGDNSGIGEVYGTLKPTRFYPYDGTTVREVLALIERNIRRSPLPLETVQEIIDLAKKYDIHLNNFSTFPEMLAQTGEGNKYKKFLKALAEKYDIGIIPGENIPYASVTEDLAEDNVLLFFPKGLDRPISARTRGQNVVTNENGKFDYLREELFKILNIRKNPNLKLRQRSRRSDKIHNNLYRNKSYFVNKSNKIINARANKIYDLRIKERANLEKLKKYVRMPFNIITGLSGAYTAYNLIDSWLDNTSMDRNMRKLKQAEKYGTIRFNNDKTIKVLRQDILNNDRRLLYAIELYNRYNNFKEGGKLLLYTNLKPISRFKINYKKQGGKLL